MQRLPWIENPLFGFSVHAGLQGLASMPMTPDSRKGGAPTPMTPDDRRAELRRRKTTLQSISEGVSSPGQEVHFSLVSHVIAGRRLSSPHAPKIMTYIAGVLAVPIDIAFPEYRKGKTE